MALCKLRVQCYVEVEIEEANYDLEVKKIGELVEKNEKKVLVLDQVKMRFNEGDICKNVEWYKNYMPLIFQYFSGPPQHISTIHRDNSYISLFAKFIRLNSESLQSIQDSYPCLTLAMQINGKCLQYVDQKWSYNKGLVVAAVSQNPTMIKMAPVIMQNDAEVLMQIVRTNANCLLELSSNLLLDKTFILNAIDVKSSVPIPKLFLKDRDVAAKLITKNAYSFVADPCDLCRDKEMIRLAIRHSSKWYSPFYHASNALQDDEDVVMDALAAGHRVLKAVSARLRATKSIAMLALKHDPAALEFCSKELRNDKEVVIAALLKDPLLLKYADDQIRDNISIVTFAVKRNGMALQFASSELKNNRDVVKSAVTQCCEAIFFASEVLQLDKHIVMIAVHQDPSIMKYIDKSLRADREVIMEAITVNSHSLEYASEELRSDTALLTLAAKQYPSTLRYVPKSFNFTKEFAMDLIKMNPICFQYIPDSFYYHYDLATAAIDGDGTMFSKLPAHMQNDKALALRAVTQNSFALNLLPPLMQEDGEICNAAARSKKSN